MKAPDPTVAELKTGMKAWLYPRLVIGAVLVIAATAYILWPR